MNFKIFSKAKVNLICVRPVNELLVFFTVRTLSFDMNQMPYSLQKTPFISMVLPDSF